MSSEKEKLFTPSVTSAVIPSSLKETLTYMTLMMFSLALLSLSNLPTLSNSSFDLYIPCMLACMRAYVDDLHIKVYINIYIYILKLTCIFGFNSCLC